MALTLRNSKMNQSRLMKKSNLITKMSPIQMHKRTISSRQAKEVCRWMKGAMSSLAATRRWSTFWWKRSRNFKRKSSRSIITVSYLNYSGANTANIDSSKWKTDCRNSVQSSLTKSR